MKKGDNIFVRAKAYVKAHPRTSFQDAIQKVKGKKAVAGVEAKKAVGKVKAKAVGKVKAAPKRKRRVAGVIASSNPARRTAGTVCGLGKAIGLENDIMKMENIRAKAKTRELRDLVQIKINKAHAQLKALQKR